MTPSPAAGSAERRATLEQVRADLADLDDEEVPRDVMTRIDAAIAAETADPGIINPSTPIP
jgi:hypothetical protein